MSKKDTAIVASRGGRDPFGLLREFATELDRAFDRRFGGWHWPTVRALETPAANWAPEIDVFERDGRLVTKVDLPGVKKEDVRVEAADGHLAISGERKNESEETKGNVYRAERSYGSFCRAVPLPQGVMLEDVKATFADGVLEVSVPLPAAPEPKVHKVQIEETSKAARSAA